MGKPAETVVLEDVGPAGDIKYYRGDGDVHHVPKRMLDELVLQEYGGSLWEPDRPDRMGDGCHRAIRNH